MKIKTFVVLCLFSFSPFAMAAPDHHGQQNHCNHKKESFLTSEKDGAKMCKKMCAMHGAKHEGMKHAGMKHSTMDHSGMKHDDHMKEDGATCDMADDCAKMCKDEGHACCGDDCADCCDSMGEKHGDHAK